MIQANVIAMSGRAVEAAGDVDVLLLDKTGTITLGNRQATAFHPGRRRRRPRSSPTPRSSPRSPTRRPRAAASSCSRRRSTASASATSTRSAPRSSRSRADAHERRRHRTAREIRKGAADAIEPYVERPRRARSPPPCTRASRRSRARAATPLVVADGAQVLGVIQLKDIVKGGIKERFAELRRMGIKTVMITGDNPLTAAAIAAEAGVDDFLAAGDARGEAQADPRAPGAAAGSSR